MELLKNLFFINSGMLSLYFYFVIIYNIDYIQNIIGNENYLNYSNFSIITGYFCSFFLNKFFFKYTKPVIKLLIISIIIFISYILFAIFVILNVKFVFYLGLILMFINGFMSFFYQEIGYGFAGIISFNEIKLLNIGMGLANFKLSIIKIIFKEASIKNPFLYFNYIIIIFMIYFYLIFYFYLSKEKEMFNAKLSNNNIKIKFFNKKLILKSIGLLASMIFTNISTLFIFPMTLFYIKFNSQILFYLLLIYSFFDLLSKFINEKIVIKTEILTHIISLSRFIICIFLIYLTKLTEINILYIILVYILCIIFVLTNGLLINSIFYQGNLLFNSDNEKYLISKWMIFGICFGNSYASIVNLFIFN